MGTSVKPLSDSIARLLTCPMCSAPLTLGTTECRCATCGATYPLTGDGRPDLRLRGSKAFVHEYRLGGNLDDCVTAHIGAMPANPDAQVDYRAIPIPPALRYGNRLTRELLSYFPRPSGGGTMLDLGCGFGQLRPICAHTGMEYVGIDYDGPAMLLGDAHALPFKDNAFDFVISIAVLEHLRHPIVALREAMRVMKPGATFIGTVAFLEPFHLNSYYHPSPLGTWDLLAGSGFEVCQLEPNRSWSGLCAQSQMSLFPHAPPALTRLIALPAQLLSRLWWKLGYTLTHRRNASEHARRLINAGGFRWVCRKPLATGRGPAQDAAAARVATDDVAAPGRSTDPAPRTGGQSKVGALQPAARPAALVSR
jgi:SAM-dependent methyltransferase